MGVQQSTSLNTDTDSKRTSSEYGDRGDGTSKWYQWRRTADGGDATTGAKADAAVTDPTSSGSVVALLKGILTATRLSAAGLLKAEDAVAASGDSGVMALAIRRDTPTSDAANGDYHALHVDELTRLRVTGPKPSKASTTALANSLIVKASAGKLFRLVLNNTNAAARYFQVHNTTTVPADTAVPAMLFTVPAQSMVIVDLTDAGLAFSTGIVVCNSTTAATKTIGAADAWIDALYE